MGIKSVDLKDKFRKNTFLFSESVTQSSSCFNNVYLLARSASYAVDDIDGSIINLDGSLRSRHFLHLMNERTDLHHAQAHLKVPGRSLPLTTELPMILSRLNDISGSCQKNVPVSESFCSN